MSKRARAADMVVLSISDVTTLSTAAIVAPIAVWVLSYHGASPFPASYNSTYPFNILLPSPPCSWYHLFVFSSFLYIFFLYFFFSFFSFSFFFFSFFFFFFFFFFF